jgi:hypothetical protein
VKANHYDKLGVSNGDDVCKWYLTSINVGFALDSVVIVIALYFQN